MKPKAIDWRRYNAPCLHTDGTILVCSICLMRRADKARLQDEAETTAIKDSRGGLGVPKTLTISTPYKSIKRSFAKRGRPTEPAWSKVVKRRQRQAAYRDRQKVRA